METTTENYNKSECRVEAPSSNVHIHKRLLHLRLGKHSRRGGRKIRATGVRKFPMRACLLVTSEVMPTNMTDCPNMRWTRMIPIDMPNCTAKSSWRPSLTQRTIDNGEKLGMGGVAAPGTSTAIGCPVPNSQPWKSTCREQYMDWTGYIICMQ